jgi:hypothetical protein
MFVIYDSQAVAGFTEFLFVSTLERSAWLYSRKTNTATGLNWKRDKILINTLLLVVKSIPAIERTYDDKTNIWTVETSVWEELKPRLLHGASVVGGYLTATPLSDFSSSHWSGQRNISYATLKDYVMNNPLPLGHQKAIPNAEDFFYTHSQPATTKSESAHDIQMKLEGLLEPVCGIFSIREQDDTQLKKLYRKAAMLYHPDRNAGDSSRMTELNYYYQLYTSHKGVTA